MTLDGAPANSLSPVTLIASSRRRIIAPGDCVMATVRKKGFLWYFFRAPVYLYRWRLGWLLGHRVLLLAHIGRRTGLRRHTVLEVVEYRSDGPEVVVANGFGPDCDWVRNIEARGGEEVTVGRKHFAASHRYLGEEEAVRVMREYEQRNRFIAPVVRRGLSWLLGWQYHGTEEDRHRMVRQLPLIAFRAIASSRVQLMAARRIA